MGLYQGNVSLVSNKTPYDYAKDAGYTGSESEYYETQINAATKTYVDVTVDGAIDTAIGGNY